jgi:CheY-like chemotaxis protein
MPILDGHELLSVMKSNPRLRLLPVVVWSGSNNPDDIRTAYELGACAYMVKCTDIRKVEAQVAAFSDFWLSHVQYLQLPGVSPELVHHARSLPRAQPDTKLFASSRQTRFAGIHC